MAQSYLVGLTGGIGSGKSEVANLFAARGADVLDADVVAHAVSKRGEPGYEAIVATFGEAF
ncbi:MAG TPA: dephospho-CoA kinase, partial [Casimicrobiaceae bacterium]|nr:dephospho-CoA kinase [Casimicrobiaceae bacterium]